MRSARACEYLMSLGFENVTNATGGMDAFRKL
jgi:rhodanese-related sulfurtransferase